MSAAEWVGRQLKLFFPTVGQQFSCTPQFLRLMMEFDSLLCEHGPAVAAEELNDFEFWAKWLIKKARGGDGASLIQKTPSTE